MERNKRPVVVEEENFKLSIREMLKRRHFKDIIGMLIWLREQKQLAVEANQRRVKKYQNQMRMLEEMVAEEEAKTENGS